MKSELSEELRRYMIRRGYAEGLAEAISRYLNTDWTARRMIGYLRQYDKLPDEEVVDEMLAILSDRDRIMQKKELEYNQSRINEMYRYGLGVEDEDW